MATRPLDINNELILPLNEAQIDQLKRPQNFTYEEEFYILFDLINNMVNSRNISSFFMALGMEDAGMAERDKAITALKAGFCLYDLGGLSSVIPEPGPNFFPNDKHLNPVHREWGKKVRDTIAGNDLLAQVWALRVDSLSCRAKLDAKRSTEIEQIYFKTPKEENQKYWDLHFAKCEVDAEQAQLDIHLLNAIETAFGKYWKDNKAAPVDEIFNTVTEEHQKKYKHQIAFLEARRKAVADKITKELKNIPSSESVASSAIEQFGNIAVVSKDCGDDNCPVHGKNGIAKSILENTSEKAPTNTKLLTAGKEDSKTAVMTVVKSRSDTKTDTKKENTSMAIASKDKEIKFTNVSVQFVDDPNNKHIVLPQGMSLQEGIKWLQKIGEEETRTFAFQYKFTGWYPLDAMWAAYRALAELHGFVHVGDFQGWWGPTPPSMMTIDIAFGKTAQIPWGPIEVSGFSSPLTPSIEIVQGLPTLVFSATIRNNERKIADALMVRTQTMLKEASIYRGRAIEVDFTMFSPRDFRFDATKAPRFWDVSGISEDDLILPQDVYAQIRTNLFGPIKRTNQARQHKVPLRRGVLIDGKYGVGKTLAARVTAKLCEDNGWTFLYLKNLDQLESALYFAKKYEPCVIFAEDVNRVVNGKRDADMDRLFNIIDGVDRKKDEVMVVFTTNDLDEIHAGMLRPGRIDSVIRITPPDKFAAQALVKLYGREILDPNINLSNVGTLLAGQIPAIIREAVERAKLNAILSTDEGEPLIVKESHLSLAAKEMLLHAELLQPKPSPKPDLTIFGEAIGNVIANGVRASFSSTEEKNNKDATLMGVTEVLNEAGRPANGTAGDETHW